MDSRCVCPMRIFIEVNLLNRLSPTIKTTVITACESCCGEYLLTHGNNCFTTKKKGGGVTQKQIRLTGLKTTMTIDCRNKHGSNCDSFYPADPTVISWLYGLSDEWKTSLDTVRQEVSELNWLIFLNYLIDDQGSRHVAERFGTTAVNVRVITHRIRRKLKEHHGNLTAFY